VTTGRDEDPALSAADEQLLRELTERARIGRLKLTGEGGLLGKLTKMVVEGALDDHLGYGKNAHSGPARLPAAVSRDDGHHTESPILRCRIVARKRRTPIRRLRGNG
jgi:hypothetical protein